MPNQRVVGAIACGFMATAVLGGCTPSKTPEPSDNPIVATDLSKEFANHYWGLYEQWRRCGKDFNQFTEYEQETIALAHFNTDYGSNGLPDYVVWDGFSTVQRAVAGLNRIGATRLATIVDEYFEVLRTHGFEPESESVYAFIEDCPPSVQDQFDARHAEAAHLYGDFYSRWEAEYVRRRESVKE